MIHIAVCLPDEADASFISSEMESCFLSRDILVSIQSYQDPEALLQNSLITTKPDILVYSISVQMKSVAKQIKKLHSNMISIIIGDTSKKNFEDLSILEPIYEIANPNRKNLWEYAKRAYDFYINDNSTFTYYRRPHYISTPVNDILYFVSEARRIHLFSTDHSKQTFYNKLDHIEFCLNHMNCKFIRIHKSYLVNAKYISYVDRYEVQLTNGEFLKISSYERYSQIMHELHSCKIS